MEKEYIKEIVEDWVYENISNDFEFREYQLESIVDILYNILNHQHRNYIVEAPTGSGKSLINIIAAGVLSDCFDMTSYILCSDLFLWDQYDKFLKSHKNLNNKIASLKGQTGNYKCLLNGEDIRNADCRMSGLSWSALFNKSFAQKYGYDCASRCKYLKERLKAIKSRVCIMTYQLFLFVMNNSTVNTDSQGNQIFKSHDVLFCDECHNVPEIVQLQYAASIQLSDIDKLECLFNGTTENNLDLFDSNRYEKPDSLKKYKSFNELKKELLEYWNVWKNPESRKDEDYQAMENYKAKVWNFYSLVNNIYDTIREKKSSEALSKDDIKMYKLCSWYSNYFCHWSDLYDAIKNTDIKYLLKTTNISNEDNHMSFMFRCIKEDYLVYRYLLIQAPYKVFLSATVGGKDAYDENMGFSYDIDKEKNDELNESKLDVIPSSFDFEQSPVWFLNKFKMSFKEKDISFNHLKNIIYSICSTKFSEEKGMIQTGSYNFAKQLYEGAPYDVKRRMLVYNGSREKTTMIEIHKMSKDTILVGPTLNEGIDLPGDDCRFIIIMKIPYPSLADKLVKEKIKLFPLWYNSTTSNEIIQGIGRGVRYNGDWCVTYILDACFMNLYLSTKDQYPEILQKRIKII